MWNRENEKVQGTIYSNADLRKLILPLIMEQLLAILVGMLDTVMISGVGEAAVSGVSLVDNINILVIQVFSALATGGAVAAGHALGQRREEEAGRSAWQMVLFLLYASAVTTTVLLVWHKSILRVIFGQVEEGVMKSATTYLIITGLSICPLALYNGCAALFRAMGDSKTTMYISLLMNLMNLVGNALLIFGFRMGVAGAAISTTVSRTVAAVLIFRLLFCEDRAIHFRHRVTARIHLRQIKKILYIGIPNGLESGIYFRHVGDRGQCSMRHGGEFQYSSGDGGQSGAFVGSVFLRRCGGLWSGEVLYEEADEADEWMYDRNFCDHDPTVQENASALSFDAGNGGAGGAGHSFPCLHVYVCLGAVLFPAKYIAGCRRCDVDNVHRDLFHVGISDRYGLFCQQCFSPGIDRHLDRNDHRLDVSGSVL